jgi:hypothetical protein
MFWLSSSAMAAPAPESPPAVFEFHSDFWVNLHHFLYQEGSGGMKRPSSPGAAPAAEEKLAPEEQGAWSGAVAHYQQKVVSRNILFDPGMKDIKVALATVGSEPTLEKSKGLDPELKKALEAAAPVYRSHWWTAHDRANRAWIEAVSRRLRELGPELPRELAVTYGAQWPSTPIRVDLVVFAGRVGAYTTVEPTHIAIAGGSPKIQGDVAVEVLLHEASHGLVRGIEEAITTEFKARGKQEPRDLWHAVLFYTTGEIVKRVLAKRGVADYTPYALRFGLYAQAWPTYLPALESGWQPYLDHKITLKEAIGKMADKL